MKGLGLGYSLTAVADGQSNERWEIIRTMTSWPGNSGKLPQGLGCSVSQPYKGLSPP